jgi:hypothetical protein
MECPIVFFMAALILDHEPGERSELSLIRADLYNKILAREVRVLVQMHLKDCPRCQKIRQDGQAALAIFAQLAPVPAPAGLSKLIWGRVSTRINEYGRNI